MSAITTLNNNAYYQLSDPSAGPGGNAQSNPADALLQALSTSSSADSQMSSPSAAYTLDLSPQAQQYLNGGAANPLGSASQSFTLNTQQQQTIASILAQYKDAPYTQATFDSIQNDLQAAGLDPTTLSEIDQAQSFDPAAILADDLNGNYNAADAMTSPDESTKAANYMQQVITEWQDMSGNAGNASTSSSGAVLGTGAA